MCGDLCWNVFYFWTIFFFRFCSYFLRSLAYFSFSWSIDVLSVNSKLFIAVDIWCICSLASKHKNFVKRDMIIIRYLLFTFQPEAVEYEKKFRALFNQLNGEVRTEECSDVEQRMLGRRAEDARTSSRGCSDVEQRMLGRRAEDARTSCRGCSDVEQRMLATFISYFCPTSNNFETLASVCRSCGECVNVMTRQMCSIARNLQMMW